MKWLILLATYILPALDGLAGWHDSSPFVAWPATNHLRWVDNVEAYTNQSAWTNAGYGAWTNNFARTNVYALPMFYTDFIHYDAYDMTTFIAPYYFADLPDKSFLTNLLFNAKDMRSLDCAGAMLERHLALSSANTVSNLMDNPFGFGGSRYGVFFYKTEAANISELKRWIRNNLGSFAYTTNNWQTALTMTESSLCARAYVPTNFLHYTPYRAADGAWRHYGRIYTNTYALSTTGVHSLVTSAGTETGITNYTAPTNIVIISTNTSITAESSSTDYGWDGLRRCFTSLVAIVRDNSWGIGSGTNWSAGYSTNFTYSPLVGFTGGTPDTFPDWAAVEAAAVAVNANLPYHVTAVGIPPDRYEWDFANSMTNPVTMVKTNVAPYYHAASSFEFVQGFQSRHETATYFNGSEWVLSTNIWGVTQDYQEHKRYWTNDWLNYAAPLVDAAASTNIGASVLFYAKSNSVPVFVSSNHYNAGFLSCTSTPYALTQPTLSNWGFATNNDSISDIWTGQCGEPGARLQSSMYINNRYLWVAVNPGWDEVFHPAASTNIASPTITAHQSIVFPDFSFK